MAPPRQVPLFDLVSKRQPASTPTSPGAAARTQTKPTVRLEAAPSPSAAGPGTQPAPIHIATPRAANVAPSRDPEPPHSSTGPGGAATLPRNQVIWIAAAVILVIILISYIVGVTLGKRQAETKAEQELRQLQPRPVEPLGDGAPSTLSGATSGANTGTSGNRTASTPSAAPGGVTQIRPPAPAAKPAPMSSTRPAIRGVGQPQSDPREVDLNYLALANLSEEDTRAAIAYLGSHGLDAFGIPLETGGGAANNRGPAFRLFALPGITAEEFRQRKTSRTNLEAAVLRLGEQWQKQERGPSNFSKPGWEKYTGR